MKRCFNILEYVINYMFGISKVNYPILTLECSTITTLLVASYTITFACCDTL